MGISPFDEAVQCVTVWCSDSVVSLVVGGHAVLGEHLDHLVDVAGGSEGPPHLKYTLVQCISSLLWCSVL